MVVLDQFSPPTGEVNIITGQASFLGAPSRQIHKTRALPFLFPLDISLSIIMKLVSNFFEKFSISGHCC